MKDFTTALREDRNFIMATASKACGRFIDEHDDEWSIALSAYYEAYRNYKEEKGDFHALAATVIRRRLIDSFRANARGPAMVSLDEDAEEDGERPSNLHLAEQANASKTMEANARREETLSEIAEISDILNLYGIAFYDLAEASPKAGKTRQICAAAICCVLDFFLALLRKTRLLPIRQIEEKRKLPRKKLERHRKYIIAGSEILDGDFPVLQEYFAYVTKEGYR